MPATTTKKYAFTWRKDADCGSTGGRSYIKDYRLTIECPKGYGYDKAYRKGLIPHLFEWWEPVKIDDAEMVTTLCDFDKQLRVVQNVEKANVRETQEQKYLKATEDVVKPFPLSINVMMIDGVSRPQFLRAMKSTKALLEKVHEKSSVYGFKVFQFLRYTVVGKNSIFNLTPLVSGRKLEKTSWDDKASSEFYHNS